MGQKAVMKTLVENYDPKTAPAIIISKVGLSRNEEIVMNEEFARSIYETVVEEGKNIYKELYENTEVTEKTVDYWKNVLALYHSLDEKQRNVLIDIVQQIMIDTVSSVFGILDGSSTLSGGEFEFEVKINGISTEDELQDAFLEVAEENNAK